MLIFFKSKSEDFGNKKQDFEVNIYHNFFFQYLGEKKKFEKKNNKICFAMAMAVRDCISSFAKKKIT